MYMNDGNSADVSDCTAVHFTKLFTSDTPEMIRKRLEEHRPKNFRGRPFGVGV